MNGIEADQRSMRFSGAGYWRCLLIWAFRYAVLCGEGCNCSHAKTPVWNFSDDHICAADCVLLHDARIITVSPRADRELRDHEYRLVVDKKR